jgi:hypothetical protein
MAEAFWLQNPVARSFYITDQFNSPRPYGNGKHEGIDLAATDSAGNPVAVLAAQRGIVTKTASISTGYGTYTIVKHEWPDGNVYFTWYGHMSRIEVQEGDAVNAGQRLGIAGSTGNATGIHLHLTLQHIGPGLDGYVVPDVEDPLPYFRDLAPKVREAMFIADETVPDGTTFQPGIDFLKTWRLHSSGTIPWGPDCELAFLSGDPLGAPTAVPLPNVAIGMDALVSVQMTAPSGIGRYRSYWKPRDANGTFFETVVWVEIVVAGTAELDDAKLVEDIPIPEGVELSAKQSLLKQWKVKNTGTTTWRSGYLLGFVEGEKLSAPDSITVPYTRPDEEAIVGVSMISPEAPGTYRSSWRLRNIQGLNFGEILSASVKVTNSTPDLYDELSYVDDVTIEDGTRVEPGQVMNKIWRVRNTGQSTWGPGYALVFTEGEKMGAPDSIPLPKVKPGETADISLRLTAPTDPGEFRTSWIPQNGKGEKFQYDLFAEIVVVGSIKPGDQVDDSKFEKDVTIPDSSTIQAGAAFRKTWRVRNTGTTTWNKNFSLSFKSDELMGAATDTLLTSTVDPGAVIELSIDLTAPLTPGTFKSTWQIKNERGAFFGNYFYALIRVPTPTPVTPDNRALFIAHETYPSGASVKPGQSIEKIWRVRNIGKTDWGAGYTLAYLEGAQMSGPGSIAIPFTMSNQVVRLKLSLQAPTLPGTYKGYWRLRDPGGQFFGPKLQVWIKVK